MKLPFQKNKPIDPTISPVVDNPTGVAQATPDRVGRGMVSIKDVIAPSAIEVDFTHVKIGNTYYRTLFMAGYPRYVSANWLAPLIDFDRSLSISMFVYPIEGKSVLDDLRRKVAEMEAEIASDIQRGRVVDPATEAKLEDARSLQEQLVKGIERFFQFSLYVTIAAESAEELEQISRQVSSTLGSLLIVSKNATLQMEDAFKSTLPTCTDILMITRNMDTTSLATTFPFTSSELTAGEGILYGINQHNESLVIFDRFTRENANMVVFAKAGAGKSYLIKLESLRSLIFGTEIIVIDPKSEYKNLSDAVGGQFLTFGFNSPNRINPFDLSSVYEAGENELGNKIISLHSLFKVIMGQLSAGEESTLDRALVLTYKVKGITPDPETQKNEPPLMEDLYKVLLGMEDPEAKMLSDRIEKFVKGSFIGIFDQPSNIDIKNKFTVFSLRDVDEALRPIAMFIVLDYIWTKVRKEMKRRLLVVDEAWYFMKYADSANFLMGIAKRARKYYLGVTTITQDVDDFLTSEYGKPIITNSAIQILMKQSPAAVDKLAEVFFLSEGEKHRLLAANVGEGIFFAGPSHAAIQVVASPDEHALVTTNPREILAQKQLQKEPPAGASSYQFQKNTYATAHIETDGNPYPVPNQPNQTTYNTAYPPSNNPPSPARSDAAQNTATYSPRPPIRAVVEPTSHH